MFSLTDTSGMHLFLGVMRRITVVLASIAVFIYGIFVLYPSLVSGLYLLDDWQIYSWATISLPIYGTKAEGAFLAVMSLIFLTGLLLLLIPLNVVALLLVRDELTWKQKVFWLFLVGELMLFWYVTNPAWNAFVAWAFD